jgi:hypothetical protein
MTREQHDRRIIGEKGRCQVLEITTDISAVDLIATQLLIHRVDSVSCRGQVTVDGTADVASTAYDQDLHVRASFCDRQTGSTT